MQMIDRARARVIAYYDAHYPDTARAGRRKIVTAGVVGGVALYVLGGRQINNILTEPAPDNLPVDMVSPGTSALQKAFDKLAKKVAGGNYDYFPGTIVKYEDAGTNSDGIPLVAKIVDLHVDDDRSTSECTIRIVTQKCDDEKPKVIMYAGRPPFSTLERISVDYSYQGAGGQDFKAHVAVDMGSAHVSYKRSGYGVDRDTHEPLHEEHNYSPYPTRDEEYLGKNLIDWIPGYTSGLIFETVGY